MRILIVEDDQAIASYLSKGLRQAGYSVDHLIDGESALAALERRSHDLAVMDLNLPKIDGLRVIETLRGRGFTLPILALSARGTVEQRVQGLQSGADDYLTKPFSFSELLARVAALIRRSSRSQEPTTLSLADVSLDLLKRLVHRQGVPVDLPVKEFKLLEYMMRHPDRPLSKTQLLEHVWDFGFDPQTNVVDVLVCRLRNKIDKDFSPKRIITMRGLGYVFRTG